MTRLVALQSAPFPYSGEIPGAQTSFLNVEDEGRDGRLTPSGRLYWADETYSDNRSLVHIPAGFDVNAPAVIVLYLHGHGATLTRDVLRRQNLPGQVSASGQNAVLVAPQFAVDARDSSIGKFWQPGALKNFMSEVATILSRLYGDPRSRRKFMRMPIVLFAYSGGFEPAAWALKNGGVRHRIRGVVLLDALYGHTAIFRSFISRIHHRFFVNAYGDSTARLSEQLATDLIENIVPFHGALPPSLGNGEVVLISSPVDHRDFVTNAWAPNPVADVLQRLVFAAPINDIGRF